MPREATAMEGQVQGISVQPDGQLWCQVALPMRSPQAGGNAPPSELAHLMPEPSVYIFIPVSQLPGVQVADKVQIAIYLQ